LETCVLVERRLLARAELIDDEAMCVWKLKRVRGAVERK
jgi:hypothetical protein